MQHRALGAAIAALSLVACASGSGARDEGSGNDPSSRPADSVQPEPAAPVQAEGACDASFLQVAEEVCDGRDNDCDGDVDDDVLGDRCRFSCDSEGCEAVVDIVVGTGAACALLDSGRVVCLGDNGSGALGLEHVASSDHGVHVAGIVGARSLATDGARFCALTNTEIICWGNDLRRPVVVLSGIDWVRFGVSSERICGVTQVGALQCVVPIGGFAWGNLETTDFGGALKVAGWGSTLCALGASGSVRCYDGSATYDLSTVATDLDVGMELCIVEDTQVLCAMAPYTSFAPIAGMVGVEGIRVGGDGACGVSPDGRLACWAGQAPGLEEHVTAFDTGRYLACASDRMGVVTCNREDGFIDFQGGRLPLDGAALFGDGAPGACSILDAAILAPDSVALQQGVVDGLKANRECALQCQELLDPAACEADCPPAVGATGLSESCNQCLLQYSTCVLDSPNLATCYAERSTCIGFAPEFLIARGTGESACEGDYGACLSLLPAGATCEDDADCRSGTCALFGRMAQLDSNMDRGSLPGICVNTPGARCDAGCDRCVPAGEGSVCSRYCGDCPWNWMCIGGEGNGQCRLQCGEQCEDLGGVCLIPGNAQPRYCD